MIDTKTCVTMFVWSIHVYLVINSTTGYEMYNNYIKTLLCFSIHFTQLYSGIKLIIYFHRSL